MDCARSDGSDSPRELADGEVLMLCDRRFPFDFEHDGLAVAGRQVRVRETPNSGEGTAHSVWDGAVILGKYLEHCFGREALGGTCIAELGAGTGLAGCCAAALGAAPVVLTDLPYAMPALRFAAEAAARWHLDGYGDQEGGEAGRRELETPMAAAGPKPQCASAGEAVAGAPTGPDATCSVKGEAAVAAEPSALHARHDAPDMAAVVGGAVKAAPPAQRVAVCVADWTDPSQASVAIIAAAAGVAPDVILLADVVWVEELVEPLVAALERLAEAEATTSSISGRRVAARSDGLGDETCRGPLIVAAHQTRSQATDDAFWGALGRRFEWRRVVDLRGIPSEFAPVGPLFLVEARLRIV